jgi:hypothetical protein
MTQRLDEMAGLDWQDWPRGMRSCVRMYLRNCSFRYYASRIAPSMATIDALFDYLGYGLYVGPKG